MCIRDRVLAELENIKQYTEQALYYARSEHTEKDYSVREVNLCDVVHSAIADNKYLLRQSNISIQIDDIETKVYTDEKWVRFILNQIIGNAIKYHAEQPILHFGATKTNDKIVLSKMCIRDSRWRHRRGGRFRRVDGAPLQTRRQAITIKREGLRPSLKYFVTMRACLLYTSRCV